MNDDGEVEMTDAIVLLWAAFLGTDMIRPPHPNPGLDPTPDELPRCVSSSAKVRSLPFTKKVFIPHASFTQGLASFSADSLVSVSVAAR